MADIGNVSDALALQIASVLYPNGALANASSASGRRAIIKRGWISTPDISGDCGLSSGIDYVTVMPHGGAFLPQSFDMASPWQTVSLLPSNIIATVSGNTVSVSLSDTNSPSGIVGVQINTNPGSLTPNATIAAYASTPQDTPDTIISSLASQVIGASASNNVLTIPDAYQLTAKIGSMARQRRILRRQEQMFGASVWSNSAQGRDATGGAVEQLMANTFFIPISDGSLAQLVFAGAKEIDDQQGSSIFRRLLLWKVTYLTLQEQIAPEAMWITATQTTQVKGGIVITTATASSANSGAISDENGNLYIDSAGNIMLLPNPDYNGMFIGSSGIVLGS